MKTLFVVLAILGVLWIVERAPSLGHTAFNLAGFSFSWGLLCLGGVLLFGIYKIRA